MTFREFGILIPTKGRYEFLRFFLPLYAAENQTISIFIGDSNNDLNSREFYQWIKERCFPNVYYFSYPDLTVGATLYQLAKLAKNKVSYLTFAGDDDYIFPDFIPKAAQVLKSQSKIKSVQGRAIVVEFELRNRKLKLGRFGNYWQTPQRNEKTISERLISHSENYYVANFSIQKSADYFRNVSNYVKSRQNISNHWQEFLESFSVVATGQTYYLNSAHLIRGIHSGRTLVVSGSTRDSKVYEHEKAYFQLVLAKKLKNTKNKKKIIELVVENLEQNGQKTKKSNKSLNRTKHLIRLYLPKIYFKTKNSLDFYQYKMFTEILKQIRY